jgi:CubicO group peptidase (beta-lactamase class C family)
MRSARLLPLLLLTLVPAAATAQQPQDATQRLDQVFRSWNGTATPGCAVGVARDGRTVVERAYGLADLEHAVPNTPATIFEAGSVSKQFTAAAVVLLALDGMLSLDDDIRKYIPEIPDYGPTITLRHLLTHTSGLRDWGSVAAIAGWGRSERTHTHAHVLDILSRQRALNFEPGAQYSYSNSGYNVLAVVVERVSGMSFADFSRARIFEPVGLAHTQWRDDYRRIVPGRASAYAPRGGGFAIDRPIEHVHGNGGLLTTVGDLLVWNEALASGRIGGPRFVELMHQHGVLNDGERIDYASGIRVARYHNVAEVSHTGSTGGYRAFLARYPDQQLGVAVLCNAGSVNPGSVGHFVADIFLGDAVTPVTAAPFAAAAAGAVAGGRAAAQFAPSADQLAQYVGEYYSPDVETTLIVGIRDGALTVFRRPATTMSMRPYAPAADTFDGAIGRVRFVRDAAGMITQLSVRVPRVDDLRFDRVR